MTTRDVTDILERLARIEEKLDARVTHESRICQLEQIANRAIGALSLLAFVNLLLSMYLAAAKLH